MLIRTISAIFMISLFASELPCPVISLISAFFVIRVCFFLCFCFIRFLQVLSILSSLVLLANIIKVPAIRPLLSQPVPLVAKPFEM